jgi:hypothetical protein
MTLLYGFLRGISAILLRVAEWKHGRTRKAYACAETAFGELESSCKADEVALGRPLDYAQQLRLLKASERREVARECWVRSLSEMRLPYTLGLIDMILGPSRPTSLVLVFESSVMWGCLCRRRVMRADRIPEPSILHEAGSVLPTGIAES